MGERENLCFDRIINTLKQKLGKKTKQIEHQYDVVRTSGA